MSQRLWYLKSCELFQQLDHDQLTALESRCRMRSCPRGTPVYLPADQADGVLLLAAGRVKIGSLTEEGKQTILAFVEPGEIFGELSLMGAEVREEYAETVEKSTLLLIPGEVMQQLLAENPTVSLGVTKLFVAPSTSGAANGYWDEAFWHLLGNLYLELRGSERS